MRQLPIPIARWLGFAIFTLVAGFMILAGYAFTLSTLYMNIMYALYCFGSFYCIKFAVTNAFTSQMSARIRRYSIAFIVIVGAISTILMKVLSWQSFSWFSIPPAIVMIVHIGALLVLLGRGIIDAFS